MPPQAWDPDRTHDLPMIDVPAMVRRLHADLIARRNRGAEPPYEIAVRGWLFLLLEGSVDFNGELDDDGVPVEGLPVMRIPVVIDEEIQWSRAGNQVVGYELRG